METAGIFDIPHIRPLGRFHEKAARGVGVLPLFWACSGLELCFTGESLQLILEADYRTMEPWIAVEVNGAPLLRMPVARGVSEVSLFQGMTDRRPKHVRLFKETQPMTDDPWHGLRVRGLRWKGGEFLPLPARTYRLEFLGDSLTSGEGLAGAREETSWIPPFFSASQTWARRTADLMDAEVRVISQSGWGLRSGWDNDPRHALPDCYEAVCGPALGEEDRKLGAQERNDFNVWQPDAVVINLGTNDANAMDISAWHGSGGQRFKQEDTPEGLRLVEDAALETLRLLRACNPLARLVWAHGMAGDRLHIQLERAVSRFREEDGDEDTYYLSLPAAAEEALGSRRHPGPSCHQEAAEITAAFLRDIL